jgi:hypothetical protein
MISGKKKNNKHTQKDKVFTGYQWSQGVLGSSSEQAKKIKEEKNIKGNLGYTEFIDSSKHANGELKAERVIKGVKKKNNKSEKVK